MPDPPPVIATALLRLSLNYFFVSLSSPSHFATDAARSGCEMMRCQISACRPSACGVTNLGSTVGINTEAVASSLSAPPVRPTIPTTLAPTLFAS